MCLDTITKRYETPDPAEREAWKVFTYRSGVMEGACTERAITKGTWLRSASAKLYAGYPEGFHALLSKEDAKKYISAMHYNYPDGYDVVIKVRLRNILCEGTQRPISFGNAETKLSCVVADEMLVPEDAEEERWG